MRLERDQALADFNDKEIDGTYGDYLELFIQIGYVCLFTVSFPLAPLLAFINNIFELKVDLAKLIYFTRRPFPNGCESIGVWKLIFNIIIVLSIFTSAGIVMVTDRNFGDKTEDQFLNFVYMAMGFLMVKIIIQFAIPDFPSKYLTVLSRHDHVVKKYLGGNVVEQNDDSGAVPEKTVLGVRREPKMPESGDMMDTKV